MLACLASWNIDKQVKGYYALYLLLIASMMGVFISLDLFLFYVFFEVMLLPMYFLIAHLGRAQARVRRDQVPALHALRLGVHPGRDPDPLFLAKPCFGAGIQRAIRSTWFRSPSSPATPAIIPARSRLGVRALLHRVHRQAALVPVPHVASRRPRRGPDADQHDPGRHPAQDRRLRPDPAGLAAGAGGRLSTGRCTSPALGVFSIIYGALVAMAQTDFKKLVAYSSVSHMGYVTLGMAVMAIFASDGTPLDTRYYAYGVNGAMYMMLAHGITSAGMFFLVGVIYDRAHTRDLNKLGGLGNIMPLYGAHVVRDLLRIDGFAGPLRVRGRGLRGARRVQLQSDSGHPGRGGRGPDRRVHISGRSSASSWVATRPGRACLTSTCERSSSPCRWSS